MRALFQIDQAQPKVVLLLLTPVLLSSCENFDYSFPEIADDAKPRHVYYKVGECKKEEGFATTLPVDKTEYLRTETPTLKAKPTCNKGGTAKKFLHWQITDSGNDGEHKPGDKIPFTRHGKYFNATAIWQCMRETYDIDGGTGEIVPACKEPNQAYTLSDGKGKDGNFVTKAGYYLESWQVVDKGDTNLIQGATLALGASAGKAPSDDSKPMPKFKAVWKPIPVTSVTLNTTSETIHVGGSTTLTATVIPSTALNQAVTWSSDKPAIATVSNGTVTAVSAGTATITVTTQDGGKTATATIMVLLDDEVLATPTPLPSGGITFPMKKNDSGSGTINHKFAMSKKEVTYELWKKVYDWANKDGGSCTPATGQYCYTFANKGKEGNDGTAGNSPTAGNKEPVTTISWRDSIVWSNAYTEWYNAEKGGSLSMVYYTDASYTTPLRTSTNNFPVSTTAGSEDKPYIKASSPSNTDMANNIATGFRLPTKVEWEFAARLRTDTTNCVMTTGGTPTYKSITIGSTKYYFTKGNSASGATKRIGMNGMTPPSGETWETLRNEATRVAVYQKWYNGTNYVAQTLATSSTANVATKAPNALGIFDMSGNVGEWCFDIYSTARVYRGGSWDDVADRLQVGLVSSYSPRNVSSWLGFRVARSLP